MGELALPCVKCGKPLRNTTSSDANQPAAGTEFTSHGHYGSTIHDELVREDLTAPAMVLVVNICDTCILRAIEAGVIQSRSADHTIKLANHHLTDEAKAWVLAQNEKQYGSAWGEDQPVDYRAMMLRAGWSEEKLDDEERG